jgi:tRNA(adenine34) deaminase
MTKDDKYFMSIALKEAEKARLIDEVPVGCVIVKDNQIISKGHNVRETKKDALGHAEIVAIRKANKKLNSWRLNNCVIYITVEPCLMCTGAIIQSRISKIVYGAPDYKGGAIISSINALEAKNINHHPEVVSGVLEEECTDIIKTYFKNKRANIKENLE